MSITCKILPTGDLKITASNETRAHLKSEKSRGYWQCMADCFETYSTNGSFTHFDAGCGAPFVGLTSAPCIAESVTYSDIGEAEIIGRFWYFEPYQIEDDLQELIARGRVVYSLAH